MVPDATLVADPFHVMKLANTKLDECRRRVQNETLGHRGRKSDPLYRCRRLLTKAEERLDDKGREKLIGLLRAGDPNGDVATVWQAKEAVRELYAHADRRPRPRVGRPSSADDLQDTDYPIEARSLGRTLIRWKHQIAAWHTRPREQRAHRGGQQPDQAGEARRLRLHVASGTTGSAHCSTPASPTGTCWRRSHPAIPPPVAASAALIAFWQAVVSSVVPFPTAE